MDYDIVIIGAGVVGLAIAESLSQRFSRVLVLERHESFGQETSSRNSEVIHSGIYYPKDSLKAKLCVAGNKSIYLYCEQNRIPHRKTGKYIIAVDEDELPKLDELYKRALDNDVAGIRYTGIDELKLEEPNIRAMSAIYSPETGIIDSHSFMKSLEQKALGNGCDIAYKHDVFGIEKVSSGYNVSVTGPDGERFAVSSHIVINSAGLDSDRIAEMAGIDIITANYQLNYCRGHYFRLNSSPEYKVNHLIYPVPPTSTGLGIHITLDLAGGQKLGPDTQFLDERKQEYVIHDELINKFFNSVKRYLPALSIDSISADQSGIRPKLQTKGGEFRDFIIKEESDKGLPGFINLIGIESPGLTCSLEIAKYVRGII